MNREPMVQCLDCSWICQDSDCIHTYVGIFGTEDVEGTDKCPKCGSENLWELEDRRAQILVPA